MFFPCHINPAPTTVRSGCRWSFGRLGWTFPGRWSNRQSSRPTRGSFHVAGRAVGDAPTPARFMAVLPNFSLRPPPVAFSQRGTDDGDDRRLRPLPFFGRGERCTPLLPSRRRGQEPPRLAADKPSDALSKRSKRLGRSRRRQIALRARSGERVAWLLGWPGARVWLLDWPGANTRGIILSFPRSPKSWPQGAPRPLFLSSGRAAPTTLHSPSSGVRRYPWRSPPSFATA
mmetsp:Transcript_13617/g.32111  ORF Transcript_13617/g.32111 Transcript_13617/m.32111 type:complete len:230 (+) Transcript_13617:254-943(+)